MTDNRNSVCVHRACSCLMVLCYLQNTALHLAARAGHVAAVRLLLCRGAQIMLNRGDASFLHEAIHNGRKEVTSAVIDSDRFVVFELRMH